MHFNDTTAITFQDFEFVSFSRMQDQNSPHTKHGEVLFFRQSHLPEVKQFISKRCFLKKDFENEIRHLTQLQKNVCCSFSFPFILKVSPAENVFFQPFLGIPYSSFIRSSHSFLDVCDIRSIFLQTYLGILAACDIGGILDSDKHCDNILVETLPQGLVAAHTYRFQINKTEFIEISFESKYWVWLIDWGAAKPAIETGTGSRRSLSRSSSSSASDQAQTRPSRCSPGTVLRVMHRYLLSIIPTDNLKRPQIKNLLTSHPGLGLAELFTPNNYLLCDSIRLINKTLSCGEECRAYCDGHERGIASRILYDGDAITSIEYMRHKQQIMLDSVDSASTSLHPLTPAIHQQEKARKPLKWSSEYARVKAYRQKKIQHAKPGRPPRNRVSTEEETELISKKRKAAEELSKTGDMAERPKKIIRGTTEQTPSSVLLSSNPDLFKFVYDTAYVYVQMTTYGAGLGVFAKTQIPKGTKITEYRGTKENHADLSILDQTFKTHTKTIKRQFESIYGLYRPVPMVGVASLINSSTSPNVNLVIQPDAESVWAVSIKDIDIGTELLANYKF